VLGSVSSMGVRLLTERSCALWRSACAVQKGEREVAQMQQCKAWWDQQAALAAQQREQQALDKQDQAATVR
jgi:hypothetical protein